MENHERVAELEQEVKAMPVEDEPTPEPAPKPWYQSKTIRFNTVLIAVLAILTFVTGDQFPVDLPPDIDKWLAAAIALGNIALRFVTTEPIR